MSNILWWGLGYAVFSIIATPAIAYFLFRRTPEQERADREEEAQYWAVSGRRDA